MLILGKFADKIEKLVTVEGETSLQAHINAEKQGLKCLYAIFWGNEFLTLNTLAYAPFYTKEQLYRLITLAQKLYAKRIK